MLVLSRKLDQEVIIGDNVTIKVLKVKGNAVRLGIEAPGDVRIVRGELSRECHGGRSGSGHSQETEGAVSTSDTNGAAVAGQSQATITIIRSHAQGPPTVEVEDLKVPFYADRRLQRTAVDSPASGDSDRMQQLVQRVTGRTASAGTQ